MYRRIDDFLRSWEHEAADTKRIIEAVPDHAMGRHVAEGFRDLGRLAWHITQTVPEMMNRTGLSVSGADENAPLPPRIADIAKAYDAVSSSLAREIKSRWSDADLEREDNLYGDNWKRGVTLTALLMHQAHHRGQMTVLLRQAGLKVPGIYGPAKEDWASMGMEPPVV